MLFRKSKLNLQYKSEMERRLADMTESTQTVVKELANVDESRRHLETALAFGSLHNLASLVQTGVEVMWRVVQPLFTRSTAQFIGTQVVAFSLGR